MNRPLIVHLSEKGLVCNETDSHLMQIIKRNMPTDCELTAFQICLDVLRDNARALKSNHISQVRFADKTIVLFYKPGMGGLTDEKVYAAYATANMGLEAKNLLGI